VKRIKTIYEPEYEHIVTQLRKARKESKLRQQTVSDQIGKYESYLSKIEHGDRRIDVLELMKLAKIYGKELDYFVPPISSIKTGDIKTSNKIKSTSKRKSNKLPLKSKAKSKI